MPYSDLIGRGLVLYEHAVMRFYSQEAWGTKGPQEGNNPEIFPTGGGDVQTFAPVVNHQISEIWIAARDFSAQFTAATKVKLVLRSVPASEAWQDPTTPATKVLTNAVWPFLAVSAFGEDTGQRATFDSGGGTNLFHWFRFRFDPVISVSAGQLYAFNFLVVGDPTPEASWFAAVADDELGGSGGDGTVYYGYYKYNPTAPHTDTYSAYGPGSLAFRVYNNEANAHGLTLSGLHIPYEDTDGTKKLHMVLENLDPTTKAAGADGEIVVEIAYTPVS